MNMRICDLDLSLAHSPVMPRIEALYAELEHQQFRFRPHFWLSDDWFCPDGIPGVALPFYLAHPRLTRLERDYMLEVEGGNTRWCMKLLRHETGHALHNAYKLSERPDWRRIFGRPNSRYPDTYLPEPYSKRYVVNLPNWYAQAHPHEDWAETFAVWLNPESDWRRRYRNWPALKKLEYVDALMAEISQQAPRLRNKRVDSPVEKQRITIAEYYAAKRERYAADSPEFFDSDLSLLFENSHQAPHGQSASSYIRQSRDEVMYTVEKWTGEYRYRINSVLRDMTKRCDHLDLRVSRPHDEMLPEMTACLTMLVLSKMHSGGFHYII